MATNWNREKIANQLGIKAEQITDIFVSRDCKHGSPREFIYVEYNDPDWGNTQDHFSTLNGFGGSHLGEFIIKEGA